jgi:hypothetical protein
MSSSSNSNNPSQQRQQQSTTSTSSEEVLLTTDEPTRQFLLQLNETKGFVLADLDKTHLLVKASEVEGIRNAVEHWMDQNVYRAIDDEDS